MNKPSEPIHPQKVATTADMKFSSSEKMTKLELRSSAALATIYALRMLGLFMIMPVFMLYADSYEDYRPFLGGLAIGIYGLTQATFQIPFGLLSDRWGRKPIIIAGLLIFLVGSIVAAGAESIYMVILGRALQGLGAIASAVLALTADLTREDQRTKATAIIGASIGLAFAVAMILGPALVPTIGLHGLFWLTGILAGLGILVVIFNVPTPVQSGFQRDTGTLLSQFFNMFKDGQLLRFYVGIFVLHCIMTANFVVLPLQLKSQLAPTEHWIAYIISLVGALLIMLPVVRKADRKGNVKEIFLYAVGVLFVAQFFLSFANNDLIWMLAGMIMYFASFTILEAMLPSMVSKRAPAVFKGTALGVYSTSQYLGAFVGGVFGGFLVEEMDIQAVWWVCAGLTFCWLLIAITMVKPTTLKTHILRVNCDSIFKAREISEQLVTVNGIEEATVIAEDGIAYLKIDSKKLDSTALNHLLARIGGFA